MGNRSKWYKGFHGRKVYGWRGDGATWFQKHKEDYNKYARGEIRKALNRRGKNWWKYSRAHLNELKREATMYIDATRSKTIRKHRWRIYYRVKAIYQAKTKYYANRRRN